MFRGAAEGPSALFAVWRRYIIRAKNKTLSEPFLTTTAVKKSSTRNSYHSSTKRRLSLPTRTTRAWAANKTSHIQDSQMFFRSSNSDASVKEPSRTLNLFLKPPSAGLTTKCIQVSEDLPTISLWNKVRARPAALLPALCSAQRWRGDRCSHGAPCRCPHST